MSPLQRIKLNWREFANLPTSTREKKSFVLKAVAQTPKVYSLLSDDLRSDKDILSAALSNNSCINYSPLEDAPGCLCDDVNVIKAAIMIRLRDFEYASARMRKDPDDLCNLVNASSELYVHLDKDMQYNRKVAMAAIQKRGGLLYYASDSIKADRDIVKAAVSCSDSSCDPLGYASDELRDDRELVELAIKRFGGGALTSASPGLKGDLDLIKLSLESGVGDFFRHFPDHIRCDRDLCLLAVQNSSRAFRGVADSLKNDVDFCSAAVGLNPSVISWISPKIKARKSFKESAASAQSVKPDMIREAFITALKSYEEKGPLSGRGHIPRVTVSRGTAAVLRDVDLPRVYISGYGANWHYPESLVKKAALILKVKASEL